MKPNSEFEEPVRVAHVSWGLAVGGLEKLLVEIAKHADRQRVEFIFVSLGTRGELAGAIEAQGWPVVALNEAEGLRPRLALRLARLFREQKADAVHTHGTRALVYGGPAAHLAGVKKVIHTWHGVDLGERRRERLLLRTVARFPHHIVAVSQDAARLMVEQGLPAKKIRTILNGIDTERFRFHGPKADGPIVTVARLSPEKDIANLIRAAAIVRPQRPDFTLQIAGAGPCRTALVELTDKLELADCVEFLGQVQDVSALLGGARLFALSSQTEGVSLTLLEAMASGLPVIATRVGGNPEVVIDGECGILVPPAASNDLAQAMLRLLADLDMCRRMGRAGRKRVETVFDVRRMMRQYEELYRVRGDKPLDSRGD